MWSCILLTEQRWMLLAWIALFVTGYCLYHSPPRAVALALGGCKCTTAVSPCWPLGSAHWRLFPPVPWWKRTPPSCPMLLYTCEHIKSWSLLPVWICALCLHELLDSTLLCRVKMEPFKDLVSRLHTFSYSMLPFFFFFTQSILSAVLFRKLEQQLVTGVNHEQL